jgi:hypothetical protein
MVGSTTRLINMKRMLSLTVLYFAFHTIPLISVLNINLEFTYEANNLNEWGILCVKEFSINPSSQKPLSQEDIPLFIGLTVIKNIGLQAIKLTNKDQEKIDCLKNIIKKNNENLVLFAQKNRDLCQKLEEEKNKNKKLYEKIDKEKVTAQLLLAKG